jgi:hypothetical protein
VIDLCGLNGLGSASPMQHLVVYIVGDLTFAWAIFRFVAARGGSSWLWASLSTVGFFIVDLSVCIAMKVSPSEYFLHWFPGGGVAWMLVVGLAVKLRFRRTAKINS